jgi:hypothetical protein
MTPDGPSMIIYLAKTAGKQQTRRQILNMEVSDVSIELIDCAFLKFVCALHPRFAADLSACILQPPAPRKMNSTWKMRLNSLVFADTHNVRAR